MATLCNSPPDNFCTSLLKVFEHLMVLLLHLRNFDVLLQLLIYLVIIHVLFLGYFGAIVWGLYDTANSGISNVVESG